MKNSSEISIIIVTYNSEDTIEDCLKSIQKSSANIIAIDNNSQDRTWGKLQKFDVVKIKNSTNQGFAKSVNQGIKLVRKNFNPKFFLLLNPDATIDPKWLPFWVNEANFDPKIGLISPVIKDPKTKKVIFSRGQINWLKMNTSHNSSRSAREDYLTGCCLLIKKAVLDEIGGFDERFFLYYEDADFSLRARKAGFKIKTVKDTVCFHQESSSSDSKIKTYYLVKSGLMFFHKHFPWPIRTFYFWPIFHLRFFYHFWISKKDPVIKGMKDFFLNK